ncbi:hypothetical protein PMAYCL1PPCAC_26794, partial [Pristionchus mayeri]
SLVEGLLRECVRGVFSLKCGTIPINWPFAYTILVQKYSSNDLLQTSVLFRNISIVEVGRLPLLWLAPESYERWIFSPASDVWSMGVLLYELVTTGGRPYPDWATSELFDRLKNGERMERPADCSEAVYRMMRSCWELDASLRPNWRDLRMAMAAELERVCPNDDYILH